jgi:hypothetical protein
LDALDVLAKLKVQDVSLHMIDLGGDVTGNGISKLVFTILSAVAEGERLRTRRSKRRSPICARYVTLERRSGPSQRRCVKMATHCRMRLCGLCWGADSSRPTAAQMR